MTYNLNKRQGQMDFIQSYFYTDTIHNHKHLLLNDNMKMVVINSWKYLVSIGKIKIYAFVIMPNHIHLIWIMLEANGKESPAGSFAKFTAHQFQKILASNYPIELENYRVEKVDRKYQFWKRDPLAIPLTNEKTFLQKLDYIHNNPVKEKWNLTNIPENYRWSSARFYETGFDEFGILSDYRL
jgi:putative transposase